MLFVMERRIALQIPLVQVGLVIARSRRDFGPRYRWCMNKSEYDLHLSLCSICSPLAPEKNSLFCPFFFFLFNFN